MGIRSTVRWSKTAAAAAAGLGEKRQRGLCSRCWRWPPPLRQGLSLLGGFHHGCRSRCRCWVALGLRSSDRRGCGSGWMLRYWSTATAVVMDRRCQAIREP